MSNFKLVFIGVFAAVGVIAVLAFSGLIKIGGGSSSTKVEGVVTIWGTMDTRAMADFTNDYNSRNQDIHVSYVEKSPETFEATLIEAIASGSAPDLVILPDNLLFRFQDKLTHIPFASLPQRTFADTFVEGASIFAVPDGYLGVPLASDPVVLYYNRDLLQSAGIAKAPTTWQEFTDQVIKLTKKKTDLSLIQSGAALGTFRNIAHAKDILALLFMENGNPFVTNAFTGVGVHFGSSGNADEALAAQQAMEFYMAFSDPNKSVYSWSGGESLDRQAFIESRLAFYFGSASELPVIRAQNPNLNFDVALPPQGGGNATVLTSGRFYGIGIPKIAQNQILSFTAATLLVNQDSERALTEKAGTSLALLPVRRDVLGQAPVSDKYLSLLYKAGLVVHSWFDPNPTATTTIFGTLIGDISSGLLTIDQSLDKAGSQIEALGIKIL